MVAVITVLVAVLVVFVLGGVAGYVYLDAPEYDMAPRKWAGISFFVPIFGFFAYLFEREERTPDTDREEMFVGGGFEIHKSRADDTPWLSDSGENDEDGDRN
jgi:hypothetical protein